MVKAKAIDPGFSIADAEAPRLDFSAGLLRLDFQDWRQVCISVWFRNVCRFDWGDEVPDSDQRSRF